MRAGDFFRRGRRPGGGDRLWNPPPGRSLGHPQGGDVRANPALTFSTTIRLSLRRAWPHPRRPGSLQHKTHHIGGLFLCVSFRVQGQQGLWRLQDLFFGPLFQIQLSVK